MVGTSPRSSPSDIVEESNLNSTTISKSPASASGFKMLMCLKHLENGLKVRYSGTNLIQGLKLIT